MQELSATDLAFMGAEMILDVDADQYPHLDMLLDSRYVVRSDVVQSSQRYALVRPTDNGTLAVMADAPTLSKLDSVSRKFC